jgi:prepilin signal peptidase PulO-like enzyme (type II secretory pathway)
MSEKVIYSIPARFRRIENLHILFWLVKDVSWALNFRLMGMIMIVPTVLAALVITWQTRKIFSELMHNLAVVFWIFANCTWMIGEFYMADEGHQARSWAVVPFVIGLLILVVYYLLYFTQKAFREKVVQQTEDAIQEELHFEEDRQTA